MNKAVLDPVATLQAVSDATRLRLLRLLLREELNVQDLVTILELRQPSVSRHLSVLRDSGWVQQRREGTYSWYKAAPRHAELLPVVVDLAEHLPDAAADDARLAGVLAEREARGRELFAGMVDQWDQIRRQYEHPDLQAGMITALVPTGLRVVDVGTGSGALLPLLAAAAERVDAVDHSAALLARARGRCRDAGHTNVHFHQSDARRLPFAGGLFDAAYSSMVLHHLPRPQEALSELARVTRPGGRVVVVEFSRHNLGWMRDELAHRWLGFERFELEGWLHEVGLQPRRWLRRKRTDDQHIELPAAAGREGFTWPDVVLVVADRMTESETT